MIDVAMDPERAWFRNTGGVCSAFVFIVKRDVGDKNS